jgi:uncharacterized protein
MTPLNLETAREWYPNVDPVHGYEHVRRVYKMAERLAKAEGADVEIVRAAALLHDAQGSHPNGGARHSHHEDSAEFAAEVLGGLGWPEERIRAVQHCIRAHRYRSQGDTPATLEAKVLFDADKLDVLGAEGVARTIAYAIQAGQPVYEKPSRLFLEKWQEEAGEHHSAYHEYLFKLVHVRERLFTAEAKRIAGQRHQALVAYFEQLEGEEEGTR